MVGARRDPVRRRLDDLDRARLGVRALGLADDRADAVAGHGAGDEHDVAVVARDAVAAVGERVDRQLELVAARRAGLRRVVDTRSRMTAYGSLRSIAASTDLRFALRRSWSRTRAQLRGRQAVELLGHLRGRQVVVLVDRERGQPSARGGADQPVGRRRSRGATSSASSSARVVARHPPALDRVVEHLLDALAREHERLESG